jgi:hypothetical protein
MSLILKTSCLKSSIIKYQDIAKNLQANYLQTLSPGFGNEFAQHFLELISLSKNKSRLSKIT